MSTPGYEDCSQCNGTGDVRNYPYADKYCRFCKGSGNGNPLPRIVEIRAILKALEEAWLRNPDLKLGDLVTEANPNGCRFPLTKTKDCHWIPWLTEWAR